MYINILVSSRFTKKITYKKKNKHVNLLVYIFLYFEYTTIYISDMWYCNMCALMNMPFWDNRHVWENS